MSIADNVINIAQLGTANRKMTSGELPEGLADTLERVKAKAADEEEVFYKGAAAFFAYYRSGLEPVKVKDPVPVSEAEPEARPYTGKQAAALLGVLLGEKFSHLLLFWYRKAMESGRLILPEYLPEVLTRAYLPGSQTARSERKYLVSLVGNRGRWLLPLMNFPALQEEGDESWETANHADRKQILTRAREKEPARALEMLRGEWKNESAQHRAEFLGCLATGLSVADETFLEEVRANDRSGTVKDEALRLLRMMPDSAIIRFYTDVLKKHLHYRRLLGWSVDPVAYSDELKKTGIGEVSGNKGESDSDFILRQVAQAVPLSCWCDIMACDAETAVRRLRKSPPFPKHFYFADAILNFNDQAWAFCLLKEERVLEHPEWMPLVALLSPEQREQVNLGGQPERNFHVGPWLDGSGQEWGERFSRGVLKTIFSMDYCYYDRPMCEQLALRFPSSMIDYVTELGATKEGNGRNWEFTTRMLQLLQLKKDIIGEFREAGVS